MMRENINIKILSTTTCIKCKSLIPLLKEFLDEEGIPYTQHDALKDGLDLVRELGIVSVPTILIYKDMQIAPKIFTGDFRVQDIVDYLSNEV